MAGWIKSLKPRTKLFGLVLGFLILAGIAVSGYFVYKANVSASSTGDTVCVLSGSNRSNHATYSYQLYTGAPGGFHWRKSSGDSTMPDSLYTGDGSGTLIDSNSNKYYSASTDKCTESATSTGGADGLTGDTPTATGLTGDTPTATGLTGDTPTATGLTGDTGGMICVDINGKKATYEKLNVPESDNTTKYTYWSPLDGTDSALPAELEIDETLGSNITSQTVARKLGDSVSGYAVTTGACDAGTSPQTDTSQNMKVSVSAFNGNGKPALDVAFNYRVRTKKGWENYAGGGEITSEATNNAVLLIPTRSDLAKTGNNIDVVAYKSLDKGKRTLSADKSVPESAFVFKADQTKEIKFTFSNLTNDEAADTTASYSAAAGNGLQAAVTGQEVYLPTGNANIILSTVVLSLASPNHFTEAGGAEMTVHLYYPNSLLNQKTSKIQLENVAYAIDNPLSASADLVMVEKTDVSITVLDKDGKPKSNARVLLHWARSDWKDEERFTDSNGKYLWTDSEGKVKEATGLYIGAGFPQSNSQMQHLVVDQGYSGSVTLKEDSSGNFSALSGTAAGAGADTGTGGNSGLGYQINSVAPYKKDEIQPAWGIGAENLKTALSQLGQNTGGYFEREVTIHIPDEPYPVAIKGIAEGGIVQVDVAKDGFATTKWWAKITGETNMTNLPTALVGRNPEPPKIKSGSIEIIKTLLPKYHAYKANGYSACGAGYAIFIEEYPYAGWQCAEYDEKTNTWTKMYVTDKANMETSTGNYGIGIFTGNGEGLIGGLGLPNTVAGRAQPCGMSDLLSMGANAKNKPDLLSVLTGALMYEPTRQSERSQLEQNGMSSSAANAQAQSSALAKSLLIASGRSFTISKSSGDCYGMNSVPPGLMLNNPMTQIVLGVAQGLYTPGSY